MPPLKTATRSPGEKQFATAASIPPEPLAVSSSTSFSVWKTYLSPSSTRPSISPNSAERWWTILTCESPTGGGIGVGPGVNM